ncbi:MFS general substrate transporter [Pholiota conissans]|uniref:MFS general substrate transporter n=1 Tax=Pholiota conissans TaxID=109636 RepID=A0A9P6CYX2_9AGAR|nr:MFS general substrate transporter [Pholiota conissans]
MTEEKNNVKADDLLESGRSITKSEANSSSDASDASDIDPVAEAKLVRKLDIIMLPLFTLIYALNFIDRTAIGNAKIAGLEKDLGMKGFDLNIALTVFYICYFISDIPANLIMKRVGSVWIAFLTFAFGIVSFGSAFIHNYNQMIVTRVFLGLAEGGSLSALVYLLARYYRRKELVLRTGLFFGLAPSIAGAFGGLLASGLLSLDNFGVVKSWRKIFFVEGIITTGIGLILFFIIPDDPLTTKIFSPAERELAIARMNADAVFKNDGKKEATTLKLFLQSFNLWTLVCAVGFTFINISFQGLSLFLPTVVNSLGKYTVVQAQLRTVPPFVVAGVWVVVIITWSFKMKQRAIPIMTSVLLQVAGYAITIATKNPHARYAACFLCVVGGTPCGPLFLIWGTDNAAPDTMKAMATAIIPGMGALGSLIAVWTYLPKDAPNFHKGNSLNLATGTLVVLLAVFGAFYLRWENAKRERGERDYRLEGKTEEEIRDLGYLHPKFRYQV